MSLISAAADSPVIAGFYGGWEVVLFLAVVLILFGARKLPGMSDGSGPGHRVGGKATDTSPGRGPLSRQDEFILWLAQGFDVGRIPVAPGTFGSLVGLLWFAVLLVPGSFAVYLLGMVVGFGVSVWCCGHAERILGRTDPGSVVLDEIVALPVCFLPWVMHERGLSNALPPVETFFSGDAWLRTLGVFLLFRAFDVIKPWPVRQIQSLPGGWGVTADDVLAGLYVAAVSWAMAVV
jgi:phosphatidylglycerophosphatase A